MGLITSFKFWRYTTNHVTVNKHIMSYLKTHGRMMKFLNLPKRGREIREKLASADIFSLKFPNLFGFPIV
jgi:hypothetical protein